MKNTRPKLIIDTDPGHDDALALLLILLSQRFDVLAITTVAGNSTIENVTRNARAIAELIGLEMPIFSGQARPIKRELVTAVVHGASGLAGFDTSNTPLLLTGDASQKIQELVRQNPGEVTVLALGPLSNVARALQSDPQLQGLTKQLVMMGGAIAVPGNKSRVAEFNFFVDPEAAQIVMQSNIPKVLVPLDVCNDITLQVSDFQKIGNSDFRNSLMAMMQHFQEGLRVDESVKGLLVYDALAAYYLLCPEAFVLQPMDIVVEASGEFTSGMCVLERRSYKPRVPSADVAVKLDSDRFRSDFFATLNQNQNKKGKNVK